MENKKEVTILEVSVAFLLMFTPLILIWFDGTWRYSISDYAYSEVNYLFVFLLTLAGAMFVYNGVGYKRHWYNIVLGLSLFGVALTPHNDFPILHYIFASIFFIGSIVSIGLSSNVWLKNFKYFLSGIIAIALILHFSFNLFSLLTSEWLGIAPIVTHFIIKSIYKK